MNKFEAVSGDQSLFDLVGASDDDLFIIKSVSGRSLFSHNARPSDDSSIIAERRPVEKYIPKVGDVFAIDDSHGITDTLKNLTCIFVDNKGLIWAHTKCGYVTSVSKEYNLNKIDRSPNPVNMVKYEEKWVPSVGELFRVNDDLAIRKCVKSDGFGVYSVSEGFTINQNEFHRV